MKWSQVVLCFCLPVAIVGSVGCGNDGGTTVPKAGTSEGRPQGLFFMTRYWSYTQTLEKTVWYFAPDGTVYQNLETGFSPEDLAAHTGPKGTFRVVGKEMEVTWSDGKTSKSDYGPDKSGFGWDGGTFAPVEPIADKQKIVGTYEGGASLSRSGDWASVAKKLQLNDDGTFTLDGVVFAKSETDYAVLTAGSDQTTTGTWTLSGYSLTFTDSSGKVARQIAFPYDDETTPIYPDHLFIGGTLYKHL